MKLRILPSLRERRRYIKFKVFSEEKISYSDLEQAIRNTCLEFFGEFGISNFSLNLIRNLWNEKEQIGVLKCNHLSVPHIILSLSLIQRLGDARIRIKVLKVSGTIASLNIEKA